MKITFIDTAQVHSYMVTTLESNVDPDDYVIVPVVTFSQIGFLEEDSILDTQTKNQIEVFPSTIY